MDGSRTPGSVHPWSLLTRRVPSGRPGDGLRVSAASGWAPFAPWGAEGRGAVVLGSTRDASCWARLPPRQGRRIQLKLGPRDKSQLLLLLPNIVYESQTEKMRKWNKWYEHLVTRDEVIYCSDNWKTEETLVKKIWNRWIWEVCSINLNMTKSMAFVPSSNKKLHKIISKESHLTYSLDKL